MNRCSWILGALAALVLASPTYTTGEKERTYPDMQDGLTSKLATTCFFGEPSEACAFTCNQKSMDAYCNDTLKQCVCKDPDNKGESNGEITDTENTTEIPNVKNEGGNKLTEIKDHKQTNIKLRDFCAFGYPSPQCTLHCKKKSLGAYCDKEQYICSCTSPPEEQSGVDWLKILAIILDKRPKSNLEQFAGSNTEIIIYLFNLWHQMEDGVRNDIQDSYEETAEAALSEGDESSQLIFHIYNLEPVLNQTGTNSTPNTTELSATNLVLRDLGMEIEGWAFSHVMAVILIIFLIGIVLLEVAFCIKKNEPNNRMESIFPTKQ